jgi:hypothetical protein
MSVGSDDDRRLKCSGLMQHNVSQKRKTSPHPTPTEFFGVSRTSLLKTSSADDAEYQPGSSAMDTGTEPDSD